MNLSIRQCGIAEVLTNTELLKEYIDEAALNEFETTANILPNLNPNADMYIHMENVGVLHTMGAFIDDLLVGFITILSPVMPHYSSVLAIMESFFVSKEFRSSGAGLKLLYEAEKHARDRCSPGLLISAPLGKTLEGILPRCGYKEVYTTFFKRFEDA